MRHANRLATAYFLSLLLFVSKSHSSPRVQSCPPLSGRAGRDRRHGELRVVDETKVKGLVLTGDPAFGEETVARLDEREQLS
jgi:hypothetical protein